MSATNIARSRTIHSFYAVLTEDGSYFAGFNPAEGKADFVATAQEAKLFTNKHEIKLRPAEMLVELQVDFATSQVNISEPFRPKRRVVPNK